MKKVAGIIMTILGIGCMFVSCIMFDMKTEYVATTSLLLLLGVVMTFLGGSFYAMGDLL